jgi:hypothetical protein
MTFPRLQGRRAGRGIDYPPAWFCWDRQHCGPPAIRYAWLNSTKEKSDETEKPDLKVVEPLPKEAIDSAPQPATIPAELEKELDEDEAEFRAIRKDLPGVKGASAAGIVAISVGKTPTKNEFFRSHKTFRPIVPMVDHEVGMEKQFFAVNANMVMPLKAIGSTVTDHVLYLTITTRGAYRIVPVRQADTDGDQNEYHRTNEIGLMQAIDEWVRLYTDQENGCYKAFPAPVGRFSDPQWPELKQSKIFRLAFRDKGRLIDSVEHQLFKKLTARDSE